MKRFNKTLIMFVFILILTSISVVFAGENEYQLVREMVYKNNRKTEIKNGFVEVRIGNKNIVQYQKDGDIVINPSPDEIREDEYGNMYAYFNLAGMKPGSEFRIRIQRELALDTYNKDISVRTDAYITPENEIFLKAQTKVESDDDEIVAKAKELTYGLSSDYKKALAIFEYVNTTMEYSTAETYANKGALSALKNKKGVCEEFSGLYAAMCRAAGIPTRIVEGYKFDAKTKETEDGIEVEELELVNHVWTEISLEDFGWVPVETCVIYSPNGTRMPYTNAFCKIEDIEYIATGIYNQDRANRTMQGVLETSYVDSLYEISDDDIQEHEFEDVDYRYEWSKEAISNLYDLGIVNGYTAEEYGPARNISRIEFMAMLSRCLKYMNYYPTTGGMVYYHLDYDMEHWSKEEYDFLMRCYQTVEPSDKVSMGYNTLERIFGNSISMNQAITREEVVALVDCFLDESDAAYAFSDIDGSKFKSSILKAYDSGLINGYEDGTFKPANPITRAEMAVILNRYISQYKYVL